MEDLHIAVTAPYFNERKYGGGEVWCREVSSELIDRGHTVEVVTTNMTLHQRLLEPKASLRGEPWGIPTRRHRVSYLLSSLLRPIGFYPLAPGIFFDRAFRRADVVLASGVEDPTSAVAVTAARLHGKPVLVMPHTHTDAIRRWGPFRRFLLIPIEGSHACYVQINTEAERPFWSARIHDNRVLDPVGCGIRDVPEDWIQDKREARRDLGLPPDRPVVLFLGRLHWSKGVVRAVQAVQDISQDARLYLVGFREPAPAWYRGRQVTLEQFLREQWPEGSYRMVGEVDERTKHRWLSACNLLVLPSFHESFGIVFLEAWQHGRPVIGWDTGGMPEVIDDGHTGYVVSTTEGLAKRIDTLLSDPDLAAHMGRKGEEVLEGRYRWEDVTDRVEANLQEVLRLEEEREQSKASRTSDELLEVEP